MQIFDGELRFGIHAGQQNITLDDYIKLWEITENLGYDWASVFDHFLPIMSDPEGPCFEGLTLLSAMAAKTKKLRCGIIVIGITYRNPAILAKIATTIDHVSNGRLELGIGGAWYELEHNQYGIAFPPIGRRLDMLGEAAKIIKGLWTQKRTTFDGRHYKITDALHEPKPLQQPHPPIWVGGAGEKKTLRVVAESADGWNTFLMPMDQYQHKLDVLAGHCADVGRDPGDVRKQLAMFALIGESEAEVGELKAQYEKMQASGLTMMPLLGTPEQCVEQLLPYVKAGVGDFLLLVRSPSQANVHALELFAKKIAPAVRAEYKSIAG